MKIAQKVWTETRCWALHGGQDIENADLVIITEVPW